MARVGATSAFGTAIVIVANSCIITITILTTIDTTNIISACMIIIVVRRVLRVSFVLV